MRSYSQLYIKSDSIIGKFIWKWTCHTVWKFDIIGLALSNEIKWQSRGLKCSYKFMIIIKTLRNQNAIHYITFVVLCISVSIYLCIPIMAQLYFCGRLFYFQQS